jgi:Amt family ammonium transporter
MKHIFGYDDSLDCFGVHGIGGIIGALLTGVFSYGPLSATDATPGGSPGGIHQLLLQGEGVLTTIIYSGLVSFILLKIVDVVIGLRVSSEQEQEGLDITLHGEQLG